MVRTRSWVLALAVLVGLVGMPLTPAWAKLKIEKTYNPVIVPANFSTTINNQFMPLVPGTTFIYEGETADGFEHIETVIKTDTKTVMGVLCVVVWDKAWLDGALAEETWDWYAQDTNGNVWYFGEAATQIAGGVVVGTEGSWEAGVDGALPGIVMLGNPQKGDAYRQEYYAGKAEDVAQVVNLGQHVSTFFGSYNGCLTTKEWSLVEKGSENKYYAPGVGVVLITSKTDRVELVKVTPPTGFTTTIDNPFMPLVPGTKFVYEGDTADGFEHVETVVTTDTKTITGVVCVVVWDRAWLDGALVEETFDWYAQDSRRNVWYFGEDAKQFAGGVQVGTEGSWEAGVDGALPGIVMEGSPRKGDVYRQEYYAGVAEDMAEVVSLTKNVKIAFGCYKPCLETKEWSAIEPDVLEHKYYAPNVGLVLITSKTERSELVDIIGP